MAMSLNGFVADESGSEDFISHANWETFCKLAREKGNFIIGRKTFEAVKNWDAGYGFDDLGDVTRVVLTAAKPDEIGTGYVIASSPQDALEQISGRGMQSALVSGGPTVNTAFIKAGLIDEIIFNVEPVIVGKGKPVFAGGDFLEELRLDSMKKLVDWIIQVRYTVRK